MLPSPVESTFRGFIDGERIARCKLKLGIDVLIPLRRDMDIYHDVLGLLRLKTARFQRYQPPQREPVDAPRLPHSPERVRRRELQRQTTVQAKKAALSPPPPDPVLVRSEVAGFENLRTFTTCSVPLNVIVNRDLFADGHVELWMLLDAKPLTPSNVTLWVDGEVRAMSAAAHHPDGKRWARLAPPPAPFRQPTRLLTGLRALIDPAHGPQSSVLRGHVRSAEERPARRGRAAPV